MNQKPQGYWNNKENCFNEAKKYKNVYDLERKCYGCYKGLKRNEWIREAFPNENAPFGYWNDKDKVINEGLKYKTKMEFKRGSGGAFMSAVKHGWIKEIESHFEKAVAKHIDTEAKIHYVYAYEFKDLKYCYVGRTYQMHKRDLSHRRGRKHHDGSITYDSVYMFAKNHNIDIPKPIIKDKNLNAKESLIKEDYWVNWYKNNGWGILNKAKTGEKSGSLGSMDKKWTYDACKEVCSHFNFKQEVRKYNFQCYTECLRNNWFDEFGIKNGNKRKESGFWNIKENVINEAKKYANMKTFLRKAYGAFSSMKRNGWHNDVENAFDKNNGINFLDKLRFTKEIQNDIVNEYKSQSIGIESLASKYNVAKDAIVAVLDNNGVKHKKRGNQCLRKNYIIKDWKIEKYPEKEGYHYVLTSKDGKFTTTDYKNKGGHLTSYIKNTYHVEIPSLYFRREYYKETGNYWWEQYFNYILVKNNDLIEEKE